jgi:GMP synthase (glutamine-hydrolysing)
MDCDPCDAPEVLVLQHLNEDGPGYLGDWLDAQGVRWRVLCTEAGDAYPASVRGCRGLAVLGGAWGANDERPSLRQAEALIREADALGISVIGHCLGGQLMARAFGGRVRTLEAPEIGWLPLQIGRSARAREWLGDAQQAVVYQWHYDGFTTLPPGAEPIADSPACAHQAFALRQHLAMQFHIEITPRKIADWLAHPGAAYPKALSDHPGTVQSPATQHEATARHQAGSQALADAIYRAWRARWKPA